MGDPKRFHKKYSKPLHPWSSQRIKEENKIRAEYGLKTKTEIWRIETLLRNFRSQARELIGSKRKDAEQRKRLLIGKLARLGILKENSTLEDVLALETRDLLERQLQTIVFKKGFARNAKDARQSILHGHVKLCGRVHTAPRTLVKSEDEETIMYIGPSKEPRIKQEVNAHAAKAE